MDLFITLTIITLIDAYKTRIISLILKLWPNDSKVASLTDEIKMMQRELSTISMVNEFARHVKLQRKINKLQGERKDLVKSKAFKQMKLRYILVTVLYIAIVISLLVIIFSSRSTSVMKVPPHWLWPVSSFFDWSSYVPGSITVPCWIAISSSASKTIAKHF